MPNHKGKYLDARHRLFVEKDMQGPGSLRGPGTPALNWVAVKELNSSYYFGETLFFYYIYIIYPVW